MIKKLLSYAALWLIILSMLSSCATDKASQGYTAEYPAGFDGSYISSNYCGADPNLIHIRCASNSAKASDAHAIIGVPIEDYILDTKMMLGCFWEGVSRNESIELSEPETLAWEMKSAELYWGFDNIDLSSTKCYRGSALYHSHEQALDVDAFEAYFHECIKTKAFIYDADSQNFIYEKTEKIHRTAITVTEKNFKDEIEKSTLILRLRVHFTEYENIVWDTYVVKYEDKYCIVYRLAYDTLPADKVPPEFKDVSIGDVLIPLEPFFAATEESETLIEQASKEASQ